MLNGCNDPHKYPYSIYEEALDLIDVELTIMLINYNNLNHQFSCDDNWFFFENFEQDESHDATIKIN